MTYDKLIGRFTGDMSLANNILDYYYQRNIVIQFDDKQFEVDGVYDKTMSFVSQIANHDLRKLVMMFVDQPSYWLVHGSKQHHPYPGGMAEHCFEVATLCLQCMLLKGRQHSLSRDLIIAGALLHDIGKTQIVPREDLLQEHYSHAAIGANLIWNKMQKMNVFTDKQISDMANICLAHHSTLWSETREVMYQTYECLLIHNCDEISATYDVYYERQSPTETMPAIVYNQRLFKVSFD